MNHKLLKPHIFILLCIILSSESFAQNIPQKIEIHISIPKLDGEGNGGPTNKKDKSKKKKSGILSPCELITQQVTNAKGPGVAGAFNVVSCDTNVAPSNPSPSSPQWKLTIKSDSDVLLIQTAVNQGGVWNDYSSFTINGSWMAPVIFSDTEAVSLIALRIFDDLPFLGVLPDTQLNLESPISIRTMPKTALLPQELIAYELSQNSSGVWSSRRVAVYSLSKDKKSYAIKSSENKDFKHPIYVHDARGLGQSSAAIMTKIDERLATLEKSNLLLDNFKAAHLGLRYGYSISKESDPISKAPMIGLFSEFRRGVLRGLRINYDTSPTATSVEDGIERTFGWKRLQLGYAATWAPKNFLITRLDAMPRLGLMWLNIKGAAEDPDDPELQKQFTFSLSKVPSLSLEIGAEKETKWSLIRLWVAQSIALSLFAQDKSQKIVSTRTGIDFYRDITTIKERFKIAGLIFGAFESSKITRDPSKVSSEVESGELALSNFQYQKTWTGLGLTITWW